MVIAKKEDTVGQELFAQTDADSPDAMNELMDNLDEASQKAYANEPMIKLRIGGNFLECVQNGTFHLWCCLGSILGNKVKEMTIMHHNKLLT